ncbi:prolyl oligopeptidase [Cytophagales bacterium WSM2-2]|nr:prolyl oligopeptidase [Cytophagales bacterium WSM2-2]
MEEIKGKKALEFVEQQNKLTFDKLRATKTYQGIYDKSLEIVNSTDRIVFPTIYGDFVYNFWQDKEHVRGIWRRTSKASYASGNPDWNILLDLDEMSKKEGIKWAYKGAIGLHPKYDRFIVLLSKGGGDATVKREFDVATKSFIESGFNISEAKGAVDYIDENTLIVYTDFGKGSMTTSGYARQVKLWKRGTPLKDAQLIFESDSTDVGVGGFVWRDGPASYNVVRRGITFYTRQMFIWQDNKLIKLDIPVDSRAIGLLNNQLIVDLKSDWTTGGKTFKQGSLVGLNFTSLLTGQKEIALIFQPDEFTSVESISLTRNKLLVNQLNNVRSELYIYSFDNGKWKKEKVKAPDFGAINITTTDKLTDQYYFTFANFLTPSTLYVADAKDNSLKIHKVLPAYFDASKFKVDQYKAKSADGTMIPYFVVSSKAMVYNGKNPTVLNAYGGFESSSTAFYSSTIGTAWLENGGVYVLANIRGGGEFGPKWHLAGLKEKRQNIYNDFHAVAEDLISRKITSNMNLGILGGSNGGLLVGVAFTQRPDLYNAVACAAPLLDMKRYSKLSAGASWIGEYGDPDKPEEWEYIKKYSPYQNLKKDAKYPEVLFTTATSDDRVHPGHARKMAAKMIDMGYPVYFYENTEGGHAGSSTNEQLAKAIALQYSYFLMKLKN